jgi:putative transposase
MRFPDAQPFYNGSEPSPIRGMRMKTHYSAAELAAMKLPGLPESKKGWIELAARENWPKQKRAGRGGGFEYAITSLPEAAQKALHDAQTKLVLFAAPTAPIVSVAKTKTALRETARAVVPYTAANAAQRIVRDVRLGIVNAIIRAADARRITISVSINAWLGGVKDGTMAPAQLLWCCIANNKNGFEWDVDWTSGHPAGVPRANQSLLEFARKLSRETLFRWVRLRAEKGDDALIPRKPIKDMGVPEWAPYFLAEKQRPQKPTSAAAWENMGKTLQSLGKEVPAYDLVCRWYREKYSKLDAQKGRNTGSAMNPHKFSHKRTNDGMWPLLEVHSDGWNTHFTAPHPVSGKFVTFEVWHSHDVASRKAYVHERSIGLSESMIVILGSLYAVCAEDGEPVVWQTDNTGSVKNDRVEFDPVTSIAARRGISIVHNLPGNSQANGIAENFNKYLDERAKELATYQGKGMDSLTHKRVHKVTQKMVKAQAAGDNTEFARLKAEAERAGCGLVFGSYAEAVDWVLRIVAEFNDMPHRELPMTIDPITGKKRHSTPNEVIANFIAEDWHRQPLAGAELEDAFHVHERKTVTRGVVSIMGQTYHHADMDNLNGEAVMVAYDIQDGNRVWVKSLEGDLICEAAFYTARNYRASSFYDLALDKRADAQQKRLGKKIADIEAQRPGNVIEHAGYEALAIEIPAIEMPSVQPVAVSAAKPANVLAMPVQRPMFASDAAKYRWLKTNTQEANEQDATWLDWYCNTGEWEDLFGDVQNEAVAK